MVNQIKPKHRKWTPEVTGAIDRDKYDKTVIGPYDHEPLLINARATVGKDNREYIDYIPRATVGKDNRGSPDQTSH